MVRETEDKRIQKNWNVEQEIKLESLNGTTKGDDYLSFLFF